MTLRVMNGMDQGSTGQISWELAGCTVNDSLVDSFGTGTPRFGDTTHRYWFTDNGTGEFRIDFPTTFSGDVIWGSFAFQPVAGGSQGGDAWGIHRGGSTWTSGGILDATYGVFHLDWQGGVLYQFYDGAGTAVGNPFSLENSKWYWFDFVCTATATGTLTVKMNGNTIVNNVSGDYVGTSGAGSAAYSFCIDPSKNGWLWDDFAFGDGAGSLNITFLGEQWIQIILPDGDSTNTGFTTLLPTTPVDRYSKINEAGSEDDDTSYCDTAALSDEYTVTLAALVDSPISGGIAGLQLSQRGRRSSGVDVTTLRSRVDSGGTYYNGTDKVMADTYDNVTDIWEQDPNAGPAAWTETTVNALLASGIMV